MLRLLSAAGVCLAMSTALYADEPQWQSLLGEIRPADALAGSWTVGKDEVSVTAATGARIPLPVAPQGEYDFRVSFTR